MPTVPTDNVDIRCTDRECLGNRSNIQGMLLTIRNGFHCPYCRGFAFTISSTKPLPPGRCYKCGSDTVTGNLCDTCLAPALEELRGANRAERREYSFESYCIKLPLRYISMRVCIVTQNIRGAWFHNWPTRPGVGK